MSSLTPSTKKGNGFPASAPGDPFPLPLSRVRQTARSITGRVRHALLSAETEFPPLRVLVVDDHPDAAEALAAVVELLGCPVRACQDGPTALETAVEFRPQVCLLDLMMPKMDGLELASRLKQHAGCQPLLLVATTALGDIEAQTQTALAGFHAHLIKPVDSLRLIETLTRLGEVLRRSTPPPPDQS